jgi:hypothetical protein
MVKESIKHWREETQGKTLARKSERKRLLWRHRRRWENDIKLGIIEPECKDVDLICLSRVSYEQSK